MKAQIFSLALLPLVVYSQYHSRPDLAPPVLNITIPAGRDVAPGYLFVTPNPTFGSGAPSGLRQPGPYILRDDGDLVWSGFGRSPSSPSNLQVAQYKGKQVLQAFQTSFSVFPGRGYGSPVILDQHYKQIAKVEPLDSKLLEAHEYHIVGNTGLFLVYQPVQIDLTPYGGTEQQTWILDGIIQEINIATGEVVFEVNTLDFADPDESNGNLTGKPTLGTGPLDGWDYIHLNSVDKDDQGNYLVSARGSSTIYKINGRDGSVIWRLGGKLSDFELSGDLVFGWQHDARFRSRSRRGDIEVISFFDNAAGSASEKVQPHSSGRVFQLNHTDHTVTQLQRYIPPGNLSATSQGGTQRLPNGNYIVSWGSAGAITEFRASDSKPIFHTSVDVSYRSFRFEWEGHSNEAPAVVSLYDETARNITTFVSWNGDTVTRYWSFYLVSGTRTTNLGRSNKNSFETSFTFSSSRIQGDLSNNRVYAVAFDRSNRELGRSKSVTIKELIRPADH